MKRGVNWVLLIILVILITSTFSVYAQISGKTNSGIIQPSQDEQETRQLPQRTNDEIREIIQTETVVNQQDLIAYEARASQEAGYVTTRNVASRVRDIARTVVEVFEGRKIEETDVKAFAIRERENKELRDRIIDLAKAGETIRIQEKINVQETKKLEEKAIPLKRSTTTRIERSADQPEIVNEIKEFFNEVFKFSEGKVPQLLTIYPNPLDFNTCEDIAEGSEKICNLGLWVKDAYKPYTGAGDDVFTFVVANLLLPDGVTWSDDIFIYDVNFTKPEVITYQVAAMPSQIIGVRIANYYKGDIFYSNPLVLKVSSGTDYYKPAIINVTPNPINFAKLTPDKDGLYSLSVNVNNIFPPYITLEEASTTFFVDIIDPILNDSTFVYPFEYVDSDTVILKTPKVTEFVNATLTAFNYVDGEILKSNSYPLSTVEQEVVEGYEGPLDTNLTLQRAYPNGVADFSGDTELVTFSMPIGQDKNIESVDGRTQITIAGDNLNSFQATTLVNWPIHQENAYFNGESGKTYVKWALVHALVDYSGTKEQNALQLTGGSGASDGATICSGSGGTIVANTGKIEATIKGANFKGFEKVDLIEGSTKTTIVNVANSPAGELGAVAKDKNGLVYSSQYDPNAQATIVYNGPVLCEVEIKGTLFASSGQEYIDFATYLTFVKGKDYVKEWTSFENDKLTTPNGMTGTDKQLDYARFAFDIVPTLKPEEVGFSDALSQDALLLTQFPTVEKAYSIMGVTEKASNGAQSANYYPEVYNEEYLGYTVGTMTGNSEAFMEKTGAKNKYPTEMMMMVRDTASQAYVLVAQTYGPWDWPTELQATKDGKITIDTSPEHIPAELKQYTIAFRMKETKAEILIKFGRTTPGPALKDTTNDFKKTIKQHQYPLRSFASDYDYYGTQTQGMINGRYFPDAFWPLDLLSIPDQIEINNKLGLPSTNIGVKNADMKWYKYLYTPSGGGGQTNRDETYPPLSYIRTGVYGQYPGGAYLTDLNLARWRADMSVRYLKGKSCSDYVKPQDWWKNVKASNDIPTMGGTFWDGEHTWADLLLYAYLDTGEPRYKEAWDYTAEDARCAWAVNEGNWFNHRAAGMNLYVLAQHYQNSYDPKDMKEIKESLSDAVSQKGQFKATPSTSGGNPSLSMIKGWVNDPGTDVNIENLEKQTDVDAWVNKQTANLRGHYTGDAGSGECVRPWMLTHRLGNGLAHSWAILDDPALLDLLEKRIVDIAVMANNDNVYDMIQFDYTNPANSGYHYDYCFSNAPFEPSNSPLNKDGMDYQQDLIFLMAYRITGDPQWLEKGENFYKAVKAHYDADKYYAPAYVQGGTYHQSMLKVADNVGYFNS